MVIPQRAQLLGQPVHLPVQGSDLIFFFRKQFLPFSPLYMLVSPHTSRTRFPRFLGRLVL